MIIHSNTPKRKARKPNAKQRELANEWQALMKKYEPKKKLESKETKYVPEKTVVRETAYVPSLTTKGGSCEKVERHMYTGSNIIGISTLHKSNLVPVFSQEDAIEISRMRRG